MRNTNQLFKELQLFSLSMNNYVCASTYSLLGFQRNGSGGGASSSSPNATFSTNLELKCSSNNFRLTFSNIFRCIWVSIHEHNNASWSSAGAHWYVSLIGDVTDVSTLGGNQAVRIAEVKEIRFFLLTWSRSRLFTLFLNRFTKKTPLRF